MKEKKKKVDGEDIFLILQRNIITLDGKWSNQVPIEEETFGNFWKVNAVSFVKTLELRLKISTLITP